MQQSLALDIQGPISDALGDVASFIPKFLGFVVILLVGWFIAAMLRRGVNALLTRVGFDRAIERGGLARMFEGNRMTPSGLAAKLVYYAALLIVWTMAFGVWGPNPISDLLSAVVAFIPKIFIALVIIVIAAAIAKAARDLIVNMLGSLSYGKFLGNLAWALIVGLGAIAALNQVGVATTVTGPVLIAVLATIGGILVVGVGGGLVRPMQQRWERWLDVAERETRNVSETVNHDVHHNGHGQPVGEQQTQQTQQYPASTGAAQPPPQP